MKKCSIISYIDKNPLELLNKVDKESFIMCADTGYSFALQAGITPNLIIGDFDSYKGALPSHIPVIILPSEKDDTDTGLCLSYAIEKGYNHITIYGGTGGRLDHTIANIQLISDACEKGVNISLISSDSQLYPLHNSSICIEKRADSYISVFSLSEKCCGVTLKGLRYSIENAELTRGFPLGVSNEFSDKNCLISVKEGTLLIVVSEEK